MDETDLRARLEGLSAAKRALLELRLRHQGSRHSAIVPRDPGAPAPLSFAQQRLWFLHQLEPDSSAYHEASALRLEGPLDIAALQRALDTIVERHEVLRARIVLDGATPVQVPGAPRPVEMPVIDLGAASPQDVQRTIAEIRNRPFRLDGDLMLRAALLRRGPGEHILVQVKHHIASDGWSTAIFIDELCKLYGAFSRGRDNPLAPLPIQYADYAAWQRQWLQGETLDRQISFWTEYLRDLPPLELPADRPRPALQSYRGARQSLELPRALIAQLTALGRRESATLFMTLLAAFQVLLHRYSGQEDIVVGSPIAGRTRVEVEGLIGCFVNTLVLRADLSGNPTFREFLARVREAALKVYEHQELPFEKLVEELNPERDRSRNPLFQVVFAAQNMPKRREDFPGLIVTPVEIDLTSAKFDLSAVFTERAGKQVLRVEYNTDLFDGETIERMLGHFQTLLEAIAAEPASRLSELPILREAERRRILIEWNETQREYPQGCVHGLFEKQVERTPDAIAISFENVRLTYRELNNRANQLAHYLRKLGVGPETVVALCLERSIDAVVGLMGILKAGGGYLPLDPSYPAARLSHLLRDSRAQVLLTMAGYDGTLLQYDGPILRLDEDWNKISGESTTNLLQLADREALAYVIYTSGSTGQPKGVIIPHRAIYNHMVWMIAAFSLTGRDRVAQRSPLSFDASVWEILAPLMCGGQLVIAPSRAVRNPEALIEFVEKERISILQVVPTLLRMLATQDWSRCSTLRHVFCGGEALAAELCAEFRRHTAVPLTNLYGPTECTIDATFYNVVEDGQRSSVPIGRPIANAEVYILDKYLRPVPINIAGDLYIGGAGLARGYLNQPELTAEKFTANPFRSAAGARLYKTGDRARYLPDGNIEFLGRVDDQVKIHGYRIELGEIECALRQHSGVAQAVVVVREDDPGDKRIVAYCVAAGGRPLDIDEVKRFAGAKLPEYMIPAGWVTLPVLPQLPNGKIDRGALPAPEKMQPECVEAIRAARTPLERLLAQTWADVLKSTTTFGMDDNFFKLGGHSLLATQTIARLSKVLNVAIPLRFLFEAPTIRELALRITAHQLKHSAVLSNQDKDAATNRQLIEALLGELKTIP